MASIVYVDEELPEITIHELVSIDEDIDIDETKKIGINVFSLSELKDPLFLLLQKQKDSYSIPIQRKVEAMLDIHQRLVGPPTKDIALTMVPIYSVQRKDITDDLEQFIQEYDRAYQNKSYYIRRDELYNVFFTYESKNTNNFPEIKPMGEIELDTEDHTVLFEKDPILKAQIKGCKTYKGISPFNSRFNRLTLSDKLQSVKTPWKRIPFNAQSIEELDQILNVLKHPSITPSLTNVKETTDLYELWKIFIQEGIDLDEYEESEWTELLEHLETLREKDEYTPLSIKEYTPKSHTPSMMGGSLFYDVQEKLLSPLIPIFDSMKTNLLDVYRIYMESVPISRINTDQLPKRMIDFANLIKHSEDLVQSVELFKAKRQNDQLKELDTWMKRLYSIELNEVMEQLEHQKTFYQRTEYSIQDEFDRPFTSIIPEIKNIQRGSLIVPEMDDGRNADEVFERTDDFLMEQEDPDEIPLVIYDDELQMDLSNLDESQQELLNVGIRLILEVQKASGIPLDFTTIYSRVPIQLRLSKFNQLKEVLPELEDSVLQRLILLPTDQLTEGIELLVPPTLYQDIRQHLERIHQSFQKDVLQMVYSFLASWVCDIQRQVLNRQFQFNIWQGSLNCIQAWSPYGIPMEGLKMKKEGVVNYFICIVQDLTTTPGSLWKDYGSNRTREDHILSLTQIFQEDLKEVVESLQDQFKSFEKETLNKNLIDMGERVKKQVSETVEQRQKNRYLSDYMYFLKNLPSVLIQSSIAKKIHLGCCLQLLNEKYRSDYDWSGYVKEAYKLKKLYATQRYGVNKRPNLVQFTQETETMEPYSFVQPKDIMYETIPLESIHTQTEFFQPYMPVKDYQLLISGIRHLIPSIEKYMDVYRFTLSIPVSFQEDVYQMTSTELLQMYRKLIQVQYRWIQFSDDRDYLQEKIDQGLLVYEHLFQRKGYLNEIQEQSYKRLIQYFMIRQLCFPALPEYAQKNTLTIQETTVSASLIKNFCGKVYQEVALWIAAKLFPTRVDFKEYISKRREQENLEKLTLIDQMTPEERRDYVENKKLGLTELTTYLEKVKETQRDTTIEGEEEFYPKRGENDDDADPDSLNDDDY